MMHRQRGYARPPVRLRPCAPNLPQLWAVVTMAGIFLTLNLALVRPHDFWWHLRVGQWIVDHGRIPTVDLFSYTRLAEPYAYELWWLMQVTLYLLFQAGGLPLVILVHALAITAAYGLLLGVNRHTAQGDLRWAALATLGAAALGFDNLNVRPQMISILFFSLTLWLLERHAARHPAGRVGSERAGALWVLPPLFALWANAHAGFLSGLLLLGTFVAARILEWLRGQRGFPRDLLAVGLLSGLAILLTPLGLGIVEALLGIYRHPVVRWLVVEWMPPSAGERGGQLFFGFSLLLMGVLLKSRYRPNAWESIRLLLFGLLALTSRRNLLWFGFVAAPVLAAGFACWSLQSGRPGATRSGRPALNGLILLLVGLLALSSLPWLRPSLPLGEKRRAYVHPETPVEAVNFLRSQRAARRVFQPEDYGSYMIWASPEIPVFIDPRFNLYPAEQWAELLALDWARYDWEAILDRYGVNTLFLQRQRQQLLIDAARASPHWVQVYEDGQAVILERQGGE
jgi:uncharacterized protein YhhL (DUF1145 family)